MDVPLRRLPGRPVRLPSAQVLPFSTSTLPWARHRGGCSYLSVWYVVAFTLERFIVVANPLRRLSWCTKRRAKMILALLTLAAIVFNLYVPFLSAVQVC